MVDETFEYFQKISKNPFDNLAPYIAPHLVGPEWYWIRRAILMILATQNDRHTRNRLHMLLVGAAGTGKTEICLWLREHLQAIMINAELTSKVGLVGDARGSKITPGLLADCDENLLLADELDKASTKDQSVTGDTPVIIKKDKKIRIIKIKEAEKYKDFEALSVNPSTLKSEWKKVYNVSKHKENRKVLKINTIRRQKVIATSDHSFLKYDFQHEKLIPIKGSELKEGDLIPVISEMPTDGNNTEYIFTLNYIGIEELRDKAHIWRKNLVESLPFEKYEKRGKLGWQIPYEDAKTICPDLERKKIVFPLDYDFGFLTGFWLAEGEIDEKKKRMRFSNKDVNILGYVQDTLKKIPAYGNRYSGGFIIQDGATRRLVVQNIYLSKFLSLFLDEDIYNSIRGGGRCAKSKIIPSICFNFPKDFISGLLCGYFTGDGTVDINISATTVSKQLAYGVSLLLLSLNIGNYVKKREVNAYKIVIPLYFNDNFYKNVAFMGEKQNKLKKRINNRCNLTAFIPITYSFFKKYTKGMLSYKHKNVDFIRPISRDSRKGRLTKNMAKRFNKIINSQILKRLIDSNIYWIPIKKIEEIDYNDYVYDFSVKDNENFVLANGMIVHNSGLLQAMEEGYFSIIKAKHRERFKAEVRVIATANLIEKIQKPLLDRFDFIFYVHPCPRPDRANNVDKLINSFMDGQEDAYSKLIPEYMDYIREYDVKISPDHEDAVRKMIKDYILGTKTDIEYVSYRSLELSILRIAYAMAKLEMTTINDRHVKKAIWLKDQILRSIVGIYNPSK